MALPYKPMINFNVEELVVTTKYRFQDLRMKRKWNKSLIFYIFKIYLIGMLASFRGVQLIWVRRSRWSRFGR
jgi:hypothetical protein